MAYGNVSRAAMYTLFFHCHGASTYGADNFFMEVASLLILNEFR